MPFMTTGQLNTILTFYEISDPPIPSPLSSILIPILRQAITTLVRSNRAQIIGAADGGGDFCYHQSTQPPFLTEQPNQTHLTEQWIRLILTYTRRRRLFVIRVEDAEVPGGNWDEILRNKRINRQVLPSYLSLLMARMVAKNVVVYEPPKHIRAVMLYWCLPEEWADVLHSWATVTGQLNTILTFYEISDPPIPSPLSGIPVPLLQRAITTLTHFDRSHIIGVVDSEGVKFFAATYSTVNRALG
ncbi:hypothetical protein K503DRAFT_869873 [Rhizopogon vinicolor AM-OR11-026]|uniref:ESCRT-II complex vps25 subunit n=1 Tax=Rhizopogon vinicolor AM-OR11-026 TaxID=1314800 RepID=A0A1B7MK17_9AGAM|nr:hypothetical protein K503DRAFT_869873 [Rhizopogon vinicolor AM-OR11-026]